MDPLQSPPPLFSTQSNAVQATQQATGTDRAVISSDFETFLRMLTAQVQNQDPLNPVDSTDYATQLATFSSVEQQVLTNDLLRAMGDQLGGGALREASGWIGMEALARAPVMFEGSPVVYRPDFAPGADTAALVVRNAQGDVIQRLAIDPGLDQGSWDGTDSFGAPAPAGVYRLEIESYENGALIDTRLSTAYSRIEEARLDGGVVMLRLADGSEVAASLVTGLRAAAS